MRACDELESIGIFHCPECCCNLGDDWDYADFSNRTVVICPQCKEKIYLNNYTVEK